MNSHEIEQNLKRMMTEFSQENFVFDLLLAYGISKASITRLKSGDFNLSKVEGEILYKKKIFFKVLPGDKLLSSIESLSKEERIVKHAPRFAVVTDFKSLVAKDLKLGKNLDIPIQELASHYGFFLPLANSEFNSVYHLDAEADRNAAYKMALLYDELVSKNQDIYTSKESVHNLNVFLSRLLFCFFAEDTGIFEPKGIFTDTLALHTNPNGADTHHFLNRFFLKLNSEQTNDFPAHLSHFPYVNGGLFGGSNIYCPHFSAKARNLLIDLGGLNWKKINPDIFGSMIQAVVMPEYRSDLGMHYTSVPNILKLIKPLFLDELYEQFENSKTIPQLRKLINRIAKIKFFDPACGSGNFLIITYKEIRLLEIKILQRIIDLSPNPSLEFTSIRLSQFYGIEIDDFAHEMAILSLWLAEHQMNKVFEEMLFDFGKSKPILPLKQAGQIKFGNAVRIDWKSVCPIEKDDEIYIIGNPPYLGARLQDEEQKKDMEVVFKGIHGYNNMDYISCWFFKARLYIEDINGKAAFVTTNSITQGEQVGLLWPQIISEKIEISFAYLSFKWTNNAKGAAGVTVIILGLRNKSNYPKFIFSGNIIKEARNISPYLIDCSNVIIYGRSNPLSNFPEINFGSMANDNGHLILSEYEKQDILSQYPAANRFIKNFIGGVEFINGHNRYCLWIDSNNVDESLKIAPIASRIAKVRELREKSGRAATKKLASLPYRFGEVRHQESDSIIVPRTSSEKREYIPIGFLTNETVISDSAMAIYDAQPWLFGVIHSKMHMVWVDAVGGKLETRYRYSAKLCYNTFPFPDISTKQKETLNLYVFAILDERAKHPEKTMAQLYEPDKMPKGLRQAHEDLDKAVEQCYRLQPFTSDSERLEYLFKLYEEMTKSGTLFEKQKKTKLRKKP